MALKQSVAAAIAELQAAFRRPPSGGRRTTTAAAIVTMEGVPLNTEVFVQSETWVGFRLTFQYPDAEVYPHHVRPDLARKDDRSLAGAGLHPNNNDFKGHTSLMLSRRTKRRDVRGDTAARKLMRVLAWLEQCPSETST